MPAQRCSLCSGEAQWDDSANSVVCLECGNLEDTTQTTLVEYREFGAIGYGTSISNEMFQALSAPALRAASGRVLAGQSSKDAKATTNYRAMRDYIDSLIRLLMVGNIAERAFYLFESAMQRGKYRWGRQAKLVAGACIVIAMNETHKAESVATVASLMDLPISSISKIFTRVAKLLQLEKVTQDPALLVPALQAYLLSLLEPKQQQKLPTRLRHFLSPLAPSRTLELGTQIAALLPTTENLNVSLTAPLACAIFIFAVEGVAGKPCPDIHSFADILGQRFGGSGAGSSKWCIMTRYNSLLPLLLQWKAEIPWCRSDQNPNKRKDHRIQISHALQDVVQFHDSIRGGQLSQRFSRATIPTWSEDELIGCMQPSTVCVDPAVDAVGNEQTVVPLCETRTSGSPLTVGSSSALFLLSPTAELATKAPKTKRDEYLHANGLSGMHSLLTAETDICEPLTRLQALALLRISEGKEIEEDELFGDGELESMMRSHAEVEFLKARVDWAHVSPQGDMEADAINRLDLFSDSLASTPGLALVLRRK